MAVWQETAQQRVDAARKPLVSDAGGAASDVAAGGSGAKSSGAGGFLEGARLLLSQAGRNVTEARGYPFISQNAMIKWFWKVNTPNNSSTQ